MSLNHPAIFEVASPNRAHGWLVFSVVGPQKGVEYYFMDCVVDSARFPFVRSGTILEERCKSDNVFSAVFLHKPTPGEITNIRGNIELLYSEHKLYQPEVCRQLLNRYAET